MDENPKNEQMNEKIKTQNIWTKIQKKEQMNEN